MQLQWILYHGQTLGIGILEIVIWLIQDVLMIGQQQNPYFPIQNQKKIQANYY
tara:strand:+ start:10944 stop:11102 length:159 start_codon:yes stop_codon:yes gene_type:complete